MRAAKFLLVLSIVALMPTLGWAAGGTGLVGTAHDFSGQSVTGGNGETFTTGLCTFCHTPHRAIQTLLLWNHTLSSAQYNWDVPATTAGTLFPTNVSGQDYKGPSTKCLSCHDGSVAIGDVAWFGEGKPTLPLDTRQHTWPDAFNVGARDGVLGSMKGNHPVMMPYPIGGVQNTYNGVTTSSALTFTEFKSPPTLPIRLFKMDGSGNVTYAGDAPSGTSNGIECSSCHDPHNKASIDDLFLRGKVGGSGSDYLCNECHTKDQ